MRQGASAALTKRCDLPPAPELSAPAAPSGNPRGVLELEAVLLGSSWLLRLLFLLGMLKSVSKPNVPAGSRACCKVGHPARCAQGLPRAQ